MENPEYVYLCYSRQALKELAAARFERIYLDRDKAIQWVNKKNCQQKRYYFMVADTVSD